MSDTDEQRAAKITALIEERRGYKIHGLKDRVAEVDAELKRLGAEGKTPYKRENVLKRAPAKRATKASG